MKNKRSGSTRDNPMKSCSILIITIGASFWAAAPSGGMQIIKQLSKTTEILHRTIGQYFLLELLHTGKMAYVLCNSTFTLFPVRYKALQKWPEPLSTKVLSSNKNGLCRLFICWVKYTPAGDLEKSRFVSCQPGVWAGSLGMWKAAIVVGIAEVSLLKSNHLQRFTQLNQCRGQTCQAGYSGKNTDTSKITSVYHFDRSALDNSGSLNQMWWSGIINSTCSWVCVTHDGPRGRGKATYVCFFVWIDAGGLFWAVASGAVPNYTLVWSLPRLTCLAL